MEAVALDRKTHKYSNHLPGVTTILKDVSLMDDKWFTDEGKERGSYLHLISEYYDQGDLDESTIDPRLMPYFEAYKTFRTQYDREFEWIEAPQSDPTGVYAGTPDRILVSRPRALWDLKTGAPQKWHKIQSAAYVNCLDDPFSYSRFCLYLKNNGKFSVVEHPKAEYIRDLAIFQSALNIYYFKRGN